MPRYVEVSDRGQVTLLPECLDNYITEDNPVRAVDAFVEELDLEALGFARAAAASTGRPVNSRDRNFSPIKIDRRIEQIEESVQRYLDALETADRTQPVEAEAKTKRLTQEIDRLRQRVRELTELKEQLQSREDVAHEVTNVGNDRGQLANMADQARSAMGKAKLEAIADRGYFSGPQIKACEEAGITAYVPKPMTSNSAAEGRFSKADFVYIQRDDVYLCPAGERLRWRQTTEKKNPLLLKQRLRQLRPARPATEFSHSLGRKQPSPRACVAIGPCFPAGPARA